MSRSVVCFRTSAGPGVGMGHIMRLRALAFELRTRGWRCIFCLPSEPAKLFQHTVLSEFEVASANSDAQLAYLCQTQRVTVVVFDCYAFSKNAEQKFYDDGYLTIVLDDRASVEHVSHILMDQGLSRKKEDYAGLVPKNCKVLTGGDFALVHNDFLIARQFSGVSERVKNVLVMGGSQNHTGLAGKAVRAVTQVWPTASVTVLTGQKPQYAAALKAAINLHPGSIRHFEAVNWVSKAAAGADVAIGSASVEAIERCVIGVPSIAVCTAENQRANFEGLRKSSAAVTVEDGESIEKDLVDALDNLTQSARQRLRDNSKSLCDGRGASRFADEIELQVVL